MNMILATVAKYPELRAARERKEGNKRISAMENGEKSYFKIHIWQNAKNTP
jgi:hypothetical protein